MAPDHVLFSDDVDGMHGIQQAWGRLGAVTEAEIDNAYDERSTVDVKGVSGAEGGSDLAQESATFDLQPVDLISRPNGWMSQGTNTSSASFRQTVPYATTSVVKPACSSSAQLFSAATARQSLVNVPGSVGLLKSNAVGNTRVSTPHLAWQTQPPAPFPFKHTDSLANKSSDKSSERGSGLANVSLDLVVAEVQRKSREILCRNDINQWNNAALVPSKRLSFHQRPDRDAWAIAQIDRRVLAENQLLLEQQEESQRLRKNIRQSFVQQTEQNRQVLQ